SAPARGRDKVRVEFQAQNLRARCQVERQDLGGIAHATAEIERQERTIGKVPRKVQRDRPPVRPVLPGVDSPELFEAHRSVGAASEIVVAMSKRRLLSETKKILVNRLTEDDFRQVRAVEVFARDGANGFPSKEQSPKTRFNSNRIFAQT